MSTRERHADLGIADARRTVAEAAREIRLARMSSGSSQASCARRAGLSPSQFGRIERGELRRVAMEDIARAARAVGLRSVVRFFPSPLRVHDAGQLALLDRFERLLGPPLRLHREVALPISGDLRAWDGRIVAGPDSVSLDAESRLDDLQAVARRVMLKRRDDPDAGVVMLAVSRTARNRSIVAAHREALRADFPLDGAAIARHLRHGRIPPTGGLILL